MINSMNYKTLVDATELQRHLADAGWVVVDCRFDLADAGRGQRAFRDGHIPGAVYAHLDHDLSGPVTASSGRHPLPDAGVLERWLGANGIGNDSQVVAYDDTGGSMAVRLWWLLRWLGHDRVAVLDGGWQAWLASGNTVAGEVRAPSAQTFRGEPEMSLVVTTEQIAAGGFDGLVIDVRTPERFRGEQEPIDPVAGRVPGAVNVPLQQNLASDSRFREPGELRALYRQAGVGDDAGRAVLMCGSGVTACHGILAMEIAGLRGARLYAGSWSEWIRDPARPVARGS